jgi:putative ABC transport system permease protein
MKLPFWRRRDREKELEQEIRSHFHMSVTDRVERGESSEQAQAAARREFGSVGLVKEVTREVWGWASIEHLARDLRLGARMLVRNPGFALVAVITLALGIGANTVMFSVLNTYLLRALPYPDSRRLVQIYRTSIHSQSWPHSAANFLDQREKSTVFEQMAAVNWARPTLIEGNESAESLDALTVTADFFPALGVQASLGRVFTAEEDQPGSNLVAILSDRFWIGRFGGDPNILGRTLQIDGKDVKVIGVMPPSFEQPLLWGNVDLWRPLAFTAEQRHDRDNNYLSAVGRLKPGVTITQAQESMAALADEIGRANSSNKDESIRLQPLQLSMSDDISRKVMWYTFGLAGFVLLIACANLANLQLVRAAAQSREHAVRAALGAGRFRLLRQSLTESLLISFLGGGLSLLLAVGGVRFISRSLFSELPGAEVNLDVRVFGFALLCSMLAGLIFGGVPAWLASRADVNQALKENLRGAISGSHHRLRQVLIAGEVAFSLVLLTGSGLFVRGVERFAHLDPGWRIDGLVTGQFNLQGEKYATPAQRRAFYDRLEERLGSLPGVQQVSISGSQLVWGFNSSGGIVIEGQPEPEQGQYPECYFEPVSAQYFETMGIRLRAGRSFTASDTADHPEVLIINEAMARRFWPNEDPIGKRVGRPGSDHHWREVVGMVNDVSFPGRPGEPYTRLAMFRPIEQSPQSWATIELRTSAKPEAMAGALRHAVAEIDPAEPVNQIRTARSLVERGLGNLSLLGVLLGSFAALGLILAAVGIYGVISYTVAQRTGEIGVRIALGAVTADVLRLIMGKGAVPILTGAALGFLGGYAVARLLAWAIPTLPTRDPMAVGVITLILVAVAMAACYLPARRAARVDPMVALRYE